jgi:hypothetical protein
VGLWYRLLVGNLLSLFLSLFLSLSFFILFYFLFLLLSILFCLFVCYYVKFLFFSFLKLYCEENLKFVSQPHIFSLSFSLSSRLGSSLGDFLTHHPAFIPVVTDAIIRVLHAICILFPSFVYPDLKLDPPSSLSSSKSALTNPKPTPNQPKSALLTLPLPSLKDSSDPSKDVVKFTKLIEVLNSVLSSLHERNEGFCVPLARRGAIPLLLRLLTSSTAPLDSTLTTLTHLIANIAKR